MIWPRLPPAGDRIVWERGADGTIRGLFAPWHVALLGSGTQALAATLSALRSVWPNRDEVIFAAYNCPALVSAAVYAGCRPVLVDYAEDRPWMDLTQVAARLSKRTLAVVAVDLLGIRERYVPLRELCEQARCALVQDAAQAFPSRAGERSWQGDAVVLSFGRGKPVSLLAGGAVLTRERDFHEAIEVQRTPASFDLARHRLMVTAYNVLRRPALYPLPVSLPALHLGETRFEPLDGITTMPSELEPYVIPAVNGFRRTTGPQTLYPPLLAGSNFVDLATACGHRSHDRLARYPVLVRNVGVRDRLVEGLAPYGVSTMYGTTLPNVTGVAAHLDGENLVFPNAEKFAARLVTFPTHDGVTSDHLAGMARRLRVNVPNFTAEV